MSPQPQGHQSLGGPNYADPRQQGPGGPIDPRQQMPGPNADPRQHQNKPQQGPQIPDAQQQGMHPFDVTLL